MAGRPVFCRRRQEKQRQSLAINELLFDWMQISRFSALSVFLMSASAFNLKSYTPKPSVATEANLMLVSSSTF